MNANKHSEAYYQRILSALLIGVGALILIPVLIIFVLLGIHLGIIAAAFPSVDILWGLVIPPVVALVGLMPFVWVVIGKMDD